MRWIEVDGPPLASVADIQARYEEWKAKGAEFVAPPIDRGAEIRCYMRDPERVPD